MAEWFAKLQGEERSIHLLQEHLDGSEYRIFQEKSSYYLKIADLPGDTEPTVLHDVLDRTISIINGAAKLYFGQFNDITSHQIVRIEPDGVKEGVGFLTLQERSINLTLLPIPDGTLDTLITTAANDELAERALILYGSLAHNWKNLYLILEVIEEDIGGETELAKMKWVTRKKLKLFKQTANSFGAVGREARHASTTFQPPRKSLSLKEAQGLVNIVLNNWLAWKRN